MQRPSGECVSCWRNSVKKIFREIQVFQQNVRRVWNKFQEFLFGYAVRSIDNINISCGRFVVFWKWVYFKILICSNNLFNNILLQRPSRSFAFFLPVCIFERYNFFRHQRFSNNSSTSSGIAGVNSLIHSQASRATSHEVASNRQS